MADNSFAVGFGLGQRAFVNQQEMALAREKEARAKEAHDAQMAIANYEADTRKQLGNLADDVHRGRVPDVLNNPQGLKTQWGVMPDAQQVEELSMRSALSPEVPRIKMTENDVMSRMQPIMLRQGNVSGWSELQNRIDSNRFDEEFLARMKNNKGRPDLDKEVLPHLNLNSPRVSFAKDLDAKGRPTGYTVLAVDEKGEGKKIPLSTLQMQEVASLGQMLYENPKHAQRILQRIGAINKDLAEAVARENGLNIETTKVNNQGAHFKHSDENQRIIANAAAARAAIENAGLRRLEEGDKIGRELEGITQGLARAKSLGERGEQAAAIYAERAAGLRARLVGLGISAQDPRGATTKALSPTDVETLMSIYADAPVKMLNGKTVRVRDLPPNERVPFVLDMHRRSLAGGGGGGAGQEMDLDAVRARLTFSNVNSGGSKGYQPIHIPPDQQIDPALLAAD